MMSHEHIEKSYTDDKKVRKAIVTLLERLPDPGEQDSPFGYYIVNIEQREQEPIPVLVIIASGAKSVSALVSSLPGLVE